MNGCHATRHVIDSDWRHCAAADRNYRALVALLGCDVRSAIVIERSRPEVAVTTLINKHRHEALAKVGASLNSNDER